MNLDDARVLDRIEAAVGEAEKATSAELVVVVAPQAGSYLDREMLFGVAAGLAALAFLVFSPWAFHPALALVDFLVAFTVATAVCNRFPAWKRLVVGRRRMDRNVDAALRLAFLDEGVSATKDRTGLLVYASLFERAIRVHADFGVEGKVPPAEWNRLLAGIGNPPRDRMADALVETLGKAAGILGERLPPGGENPDEIPNRPRVAGG